jgi:hypothetical protein
VSGPYGEGSAECQSTSRRKKDSLECKAGSTKFIQAFVRKPESDSGTDKNVIVRVSVEKLLRYVVMSRIRMLLAARRLVSRSISSQQAVLVVGAR